MWASQVMPAKSWFQTALFGMANESSEGTFQCGKKGWEFSAFGWSLWEVSSLPVFTSIMSPKNPILFWSTKKPLLFIQRNLRVCFYWNSCLNKETAPVCKIWMCCSHILCLTVLSNLKNYVIHAPFYFLNPPPSSFLERKLVVLLIWIANH